MLQSANRVSAQLQDARDALTRAKEKENKAWSVLHNAKAAYARAGFVTMTFASLFSRFAKPFMGTTSITSMARISVLEQAWLRPGATLVGFKSLFSTSACHWSFSASWTANCCASVAVLAVYCCSYDPWAFFCGTCSFSFQYASQHDLAAATIQRVGYFDPTLACCPCDDDSFCDSCPGCRSTCTLEQHFCYRPFAIAWDCGCWRSFYGAASSACHCRRSARPCPGFCCVWFWRYFTSFAQPGFQASFSQVQSGPSRANPTQQEQKQRQPSAVCPARFSCAFLAGVHCYVGFRSAASAKTPRPQGLRLRMMFPYKQALTGHDIKHNCGPRLLR